MSLLDSLIFGIRTVLNSAGVELPQRSRVKFTGAVTDDPVNDWTLVDTGPGSPVSTLCGDGTVTNGSNIIGDRIEWRPIDIPKAYVGELIGRLTTNGDATPESVTLFTAANVSGYAIDVTATARRADGKYEKWKLTCSVGRDDGHGGTTKSNDTLFADATDALPPTLEIDTGAGNGIKVVISGSDVVLQLADKASGGPYGWLYCVRVQRDDRS